MAKFCPASVIWCFSLDFECSFTDVEYQLDVFINLQSNFMDGPYTSQPYSTIGSIIDLKSLSQIWTRMSILINNPGSLEICVSTYISATP